MARVLSLRNSCAANYAQAEGADIPCGQVLNPIWGCGTLHTEKPELAPLLPIKNFSFETSFPLYVSFKGSHFTMHCNTDHFYVHKVPPVNIQVLEEPIESLLLEGRGSVLEAQMLQPEKVLGGGLVQPREGKSLSENAWLSIIHMQGCLDKMFCPPSYFSTWRAWRQLSLLLKQTLRQEFVW